MSARRARRGLALAGGVVVIAGFGLALVETLSLPKWSIWVTAASAIALIAFIRALTRGT